MNVVAVILSTLKNNASVPLVTKAHNQSQDQSQLEQQIAEYRKIIRELDAKLGEQQQLNQSLTQTCSQLQHSYYQLQQHQQYHSTTTAVEQQESLSEKLRLQARISELEVKVNLLEEKLVPNLFDMIQF